MPRSCFHRDAAPAVSPPERSLRLPTQPPKDFVPTSETGLSSAEAAARLAAGQSNKQSAQPGKSIPQIIGENLFTLFNLLNFALAFCLALVGSWRNMLFLGDVN